MNEPDSHKLSQEILQLLLQPVNSLSLLESVANAIGKKLGAMACLLVSDRERPELGASGYWCAKADPSIRDTLKTQLFRCIAKSRENAGLANFSSDFEQVYYLPAPSTGAIVWRGTEEGGQNPSPEALEAIADAAAIVLMQARLQQQVHLNHTYQSLLEQFHRADSDRLDLNLALATTAKALQVERGAIILLKYSDPLYHQHDSAVVPRARCTIAHQWNAKEDIPPIHASSSFWLRDCSCCVTAWQQSPQPLAIARLREEIANNCDLLAPPFFHPDRFPALLLVPLIGMASNSSLVLGFFLFQRDRPYLWQEEEIALARWAGAQIATATIYDRTIKQVQSLVNKRTAQLQGSLEVQAKLYEQTRKQVEQLRQLIELKDEFLDSVSHELRTPLTTMKMAIRMLRQPGLPPERQAKYLEMLEREWEREYNLIQDLLALQRLETQQIDLHPVKLNLKEILEQLQQSFRETWAEKGLQAIVRYSDENDRSIPLPLYSDRDSVERILQELLANAGKYSDPDSTIYIDIELLQPDRNSEDGDRIALTIVNFGEGIASENIAGIFDKFTRGKEANQQAIAGTGLGLALVKGLVQHLNGKIEVWSRVADDRQRGETRFTLVLPQFPQQ